MGFILHCLFNDGLMDISVLYKSNYEKLKDLTYQKELGSLAKLKNLQARVRVIHLFLLRKKKELHRSGVAGESVPCIKKYLII